MRGLQQKTETGVVFLVIKHGSICEESKKEREGFEPIEVKNPRTSETFLKFIRRYEAVEGMVKGIKWYDTEDRYETRYMGWKIRLDAAGTACVLDLPFESRVSSRFMKVAENIDFTKPVDFRAWHDAKSDAIAFAVYQDGESVPQRYTRESPGDLPPPIQKFGGKWNYDDQLEFLHKRMTQVVVPRVEAAVAMKGDQPQDADGPPVDDQYPDDDEAPF